MQENIDTQSDVEDYLDISIRNTQYFDSDYLTHISNNNGNSQFVHSMDPVVREFNSYTSIDAKSHNSIKSGVDTTHENHTVNPQYIESTQNTDLNLADDEMEDFIDIEIHPTQAITQVTIMGQHKSDQGDLNVEVINVDTAPSYSMVVSNPISPPSQPNSIINIPLFAEHDLIHPSILSNIAQKNLLHEKNCLEIESYKTLESSIREQLIPQPETEIYDEKLVLEQIEELVEQHHEMILPEPEQGVIILNDEKLLPEPEMELIGPHEELLIEHTVKASTESAQKEIITPLDVQSLLHELKQKEDEISILKQKLLELSELSKQPLPATIQPVVEDTCSHKPVDAFIQVQLADTSEEMMDKVQNEEEHDHEEKNIFGLMSQATSGAVFNMIALKEPNPVDLNNDIQFSIRDTNQDEDEESRTVLQRKTEEKFKRLKRKYGANVEKPLQVATLVEAAVTTTTTVTNERRTDSDEGLNHLGDAFDHIDSEELHALLPADLPLSFLPKFINFPSKSSTTNRLVTITDEVPSKWAQVWNGLERVGWRWSRGRGLISFIYMRPHCSSGLPPYVSGLDYFINEDEVTTFVMKTIDDFKARVMSQFKFQIPTQEQLVAVEKQKKISVVVVDDAADARSLQPEEEEITYETKETFSPPLDPFKLPFAKLWKILHKKGWRWDYGVGVIRYVYYLPGYNAKNATVGVHKFESEQDVRVYVKDHDLLEKEKTSDGKKVELNLLDSFTKVMDSKVETSQEVSDSQWVLSTHRHKRKRMEASLLEKDHLTVDDKRRPVTPLPVPNPSPTVTITKVEPVNLKRNIMKIPFVELWKVLHAQGWRWDYGSGVVRYVYYLPGYHAKTAVLGIHKFEREKDVRRYLRDHQPNPLMESDEDKPALSSVTTSPKKVNFTQEVEKVRSPYNHQIELVEKVSVTARSDSSSNPPHMSLKQHVQGLPSNQTSTPTTSVKPLMKPHVLQIKPYDCLHVPSSPHGGGLATSQNSYTTGSSNITMNGFMIRSHEKLIKNNPTSTPGIFVGIKFVLTGLADSIRKKCNMIIKNLGGTVLEQIPESKSGYEEGGVVLVSQPSEYRKINYLMALAYGHLRVHYQWIMDCHHESNLLTPSQYTLPSGYSALHGLFIFPRVYPPPREGIFHPFRVINFAGEVWEKVLHAMGATLVCPNLNELEATTLSTINQKGFDVMVVDPIECIKVKKMQEGRNMASPMTTPPSSSSSVKNFSPWKRRLSAHPKGNSYRSPDASSGVSMQEMNIIETYADLYERSLMGRRNGGMGDESDVMVPMVVSTEWVAHCLQYGHLIDPSILPDVFCIQTSSGYHTITTYKAPKDQGGHRYTVLDVVYYHEQNVTWSEGCDSSEQKKVGQILRIEEVSSKVMGKEFHPSHAFTVLPLRVGFDSMSSLSSSKLMGAAIDSIVEEEVLVIDQVTSSTDKPSHPLLDHSSSLPMKYQLFPSCEENCTPIIIQQHNLLGRVTMFSEPSYARMTYCIKSMTHDVNGNPTKNRDQVENHKKKTKLSPWDDEVDTVYFYASNEWLRHSHMASILDSRLSSNKTSITVQRSQDY